MQNNVFDVLLFVLKGFMYKFIGTYIQIQDIKINRQRI